MRKKLGIVIAMLMFLACLDARAAEVGQPAPPLTVTKLNGQAFNLADAKGKVIIVHFWATWCPSCREEMPVLEAFYRKHQAQGLEVVAVSADRARNQDKVKDVMKDFTFPAAMLSDASTNGFGTESAIPVTYVVDGKGIIRARLTPDTAPLNDKMLVDAVMPLLNR